ncbi:MAG: carbohydrate ABC transporter permease [Clostridia bacterium]|nr:carbohydrate ABC transporter permease [Clostridia bacterium]
MRQMNKISKFMYKKRNKSIVYTIIAVLIAIPLLFPLYWVVISSLKGDTEIFSKIPTFFPQKIVVETYVSQLTNPDTLRAIKNSFIIAIGSTILAMLLSVPCAYGLARYRFKGKKIMIMTFLVTQMLPSSLILTPLYLIFSKVHILNTYFAPIFSTATISIPFVILVLRPIFASLPKELEEAARIDGCNRLKAFIHVILPISKNGTVTGLAFCFIYGWNDLMYSITFNYK